MNKIVKFGIIVSSLTVINLAHADRGMFTGQTTDDSKVNATQSIKNASKDYGSPGMFTGQTTLDKDEVVPSNKKGNSKLQKNRGGDGMDTRNTSNGWTRGFGDD